LGDTGYSADGTYSYRQDSDRHRPAGLRFGRNRRSM